MSGNGNGRTGGASNGQTTGFDIAGLDELNRILQELPAKIEANILRGAARAGQKVILEAAKANVPVKSGALRDSLRIKTRIRKGEVTATLVAGNKVAFYAHMVEFGTARHLIKPKKAKSLFFAGLARKVIDHPGAEQKPFMRPAIDSAAPQAIEAFRDYVATRLPKEIAKANRP